MPRDYYARERSWSHTNENQSHGINPCDSLRKCPSCQEYMVLVKTISSKVSVYCKNCFLKYNFTKFPAYEEIDYYYKMLKCFREDVKDGLLEMPEAPSGKIVGPCPICDIGKIYLVSVQYYQKRTIIKCNNPNCNAKFYLPKKGSFRQVNEKKTCKKCGWPLLIWEFKSTGSQCYLCFNRECYWRSSWKYR